MQVLAVSQPLQPQVQAPEDKLREAAADFEALLISQLLEAFRAEASSGCFGSGEDSASATMLEYAGQHLAQVISRQGGLGLSQLIVQGLKPSANSSGEAESAQTRIVPPDSRKPGAACGEVLPAAAQLLPRAR